MEYVLTALAGCLTTSLVYHAAARGIAIEQVESHLEGDLDLRGFLGISEEVRNGYENIRVTFKIKADASEEQLKELVELARKRSHVFDIISHPVPVSVELKRSWRTFTRFFSAQANGRACGSRRGARVAPGQ